MSTASAQEIFKALQDFINAPNWVERQHILKARSKLLLTDSADQILVALLQKYIGDDNAIHILEQYRALLRQCRKEGVETTFANILNPQNTNNLQMGSDSSREILQALLEVLNQPFYSPKEMPHRVELCSRALTLVDRFQQPEFWGSLQIILGSWLVQNLQNNRAENLEQAIYHYQQALEVYTRSAFPEDWAVVQNNLTNAYSDRICGERAENLEQALYHCQLALEVYTRTAFPEKWAATQNNLANTYLVRIRGERAENLEQAIYHYQLALEVRTHNAFPEDWAQTKGNLANAYFYRVRGDRADNLEQSICHCQQGLEVLSLSKLPESWAAIQTNLANAFLYRIRGNRADNLEKSIYYYQQALEILTCAAFPEKWAIIQNNLAGAYFYRIRGDRADNLEQSIYHFQQALEVRTRYAFPKDWATTQNNLANAYIYRIHGERAKNLEQSIYHFHLVLEVYTRATFPEHWALTQNNLGNAFLDRICGEQADNLEQAIHHYNQALEVRTLIAFPEYWAATQNNLGNVYRKRIRGERAENLEQAIHHYNRALEVRTHTAFPEDWATTQNNLAVAYSERIHGDRVENLSQAIHHYQQSLKIRTRATFPADHLQTQRNLGNLLFVEQRWAQTLSAYENAIASGTDLLASSYSEAGRQEEVSETAQLYTRAAYCLLHTQHYGEALVMLERGKTRLLAETLALGDLDTKVLPEKQRTPLQVARKTLRMLEAESRLPPDAPGRRSERDLSQLLLTQRANLNKLIDVIRYDNPAFIPTGLALTEILQLIPAEGALLAPLTTHHGSAVFIIPQGVTQVLPEHIIYLTDFKDDDLSALLRGTEEHPGWLYAYSAYYATHRLENWLAAIETITKRLWQSLIAPIHQQLSTLKVKRLLLLPSGGLQLLPLHASWHIGKDGQRHTLLDDYEITYAPSAYAYSIAHRRAIERTGNKALVVGINTYKKNPLINAVPEAATISSLFKVKPLCDDKATKPIVKDNATGKSYLHFSCHGSFNWNVPMDSGLILANGEPLTLAEIISELDLRSARLVILSACETGISDIRKSPDEYLSLPAGFLQAGAPAIVSSLWSVDDRSTALLMERFYHNHLKCGMTFSAALREAQLWLRDATVKELGDYYKSHIRMSADDAYSAFIELNMRGKPDDHPYANPFYWAAFTINGA